MVDQGTRQERNSGLVPGQTQQPSARRSNSLVRNVSCAAEEPWPTVVPSWEQPCCPFALLPSAGRKPGGSITNGLLPFPQLKG